MFQPMRPSLRWSSVDMRRAKACGASAAMVAVMPKPRWRVTLAIALTSTAGSLIGTWMPWRSAASGLPPQTS